MSVTFVGDICERLTRRLGLHPPTSRGASPALPPPWYHTPADEYVPPEVLPLREEGDGQQGV